ncbi:hypothetical protein F4819DRAFT_373638 [Hypoxylon fuscum]|nr:hypothetical protein F4819DRAFT_373638 [Hypoxylon fuscum]
MAMEQNNPTPDYQRIGAAYDILGTEIPRIRNIEVNHQHQEVIGVIRELRQDIQDIRQDLQGVQQTVHNIQQSQQGFNRRLVSIDNSIIRFTNKDNFRSDPESILLPLRDTVTGDIIPDCPTTVDQIHKLSAAETTRILEALQAKRVAVLHQFL